MFTASHRAGFECVCVCVCVCACLSSAHFVCVFSRIFLQTSTANWNSRNQMTPKKKVTSCLTCRRSLMRVGVCLSISQTHSDTEQFMRWCRNKQNRAERWGMKRRAKRKHCICVCGWVGMGLSCLSVFGGWGVKYEVTVWGFVAGSPAQRKTMTTCFSPEKIMRSISALTLLAKPAGDWTGQTLTCRFFYSTL